jgi:solute carrier family 35, member E1
VGTLQFFVGGLYSSFLWTTGLRAAPKLTADGKRVVRSIGFFHATGQLFTMMALESAPVSFTHIVKALEPFFSALVSAVLLGKWMKPQVYATLIPVVCGVGYACKKEPFFSWLAFNTAMVSNLAFALRAVCSKSAMSNFIGENISSANLFGLVTWLAFFMSIPMVYALEGASFIGIWNKATEVTSALILVRQIIVSGLFHYLNNEVMYLALSNVHPVTLAVGNTMKRVVIMVASVMVFRNQISLQSAIGAAVAISGVLLYSLTKQYYEKMESLAASQ